MKYVSIDIETSGLNSDMNNVLSIGAIIEDTTKKLPYEQLPKFNAIVLKNNIQGSPSALTMNKEIISLMGEYLEGTNEDRLILNTNSGYKFYEEDEVVKHFFDFLFDVVQGNGFFPAGKRLIILFPIGQQKVVAGDVGIIPLFCEPLRLLNNRMQAH